jgi:hypothetical protein
MYPPVQQTKREVYFALKGSDGSEPVDASLCEQVWQRQVVDCQSLIWRNIMSKERRSNREEKKKAVMTPKENKAARKSRKESRGLLGDQGVR